VSKIRSSLCPVSLLTSKPTINILFGSLAQLAQLLHGAHFLDLDVELLRLLSRSLCTGHLAGKSGPELGRLLGVVSDFPTEEERQAATEEPLYTQDAQHDATAPRAADAPTPPAPVCWLSTQLVNEDALEDALADADVPTLRALKGVSLAWRARARRVRKSGTTITTGWTTLHCASANATSRRSG
jgi:hypothetical protein